MVCPRHAKTWTPFSASAAATSSCVESGLEPQRAIWAPPAVNASTRTAVSFVTWRQAPSVRPLSGFSLLNLLLIWLRTGMRVEAHSVCKWPLGARALSLTWNSCILIHFFVGKVRTDYLVLLCSCNKPFTNKNKNLKISSLWRAPFVGATNSFAHGFSCRKSLIMLCLNPNCERCAVEGIFRRGY